MPPRSSITAFDLGYRSGNPRPFLDQVDMGINMGGLVRVNRQALIAEQTQQQSLLATLRLNHETTELDLKNFMGEQEELRIRLNKLQRNLADHIKLMEDAWARRHISIAIGYQLTIKTLRIELAVRFRDLNQKAIAMMDAIKATHKKLSVIEFDIVRTEVRLRVIDSQLRPVSSLGDALNAA
ncbi:hypothetical protein INS49_001895 [Diaporthe citri]|uniref:uncharacterized protein n=1 Tax=Diaporthe citri TaxID=83186 RepID=UPI001C7FB0F6|nr:uncharacterized protein INS49_001895 [Diaporthe citri]KAG6367700.1 hypothetical protein INS49_001895 [Diaporthe citri]